ncbi:DNA-binding transcriptional regulator [Caulobacter flavus]|uniref:DNA-binding transcriptional regulator n=1 Tax=Caulobacter flavus TaxID=1679497 RepID=A0A2N5D528_9CAUL|nr:YafY family protein [Caulobacter flavus]AYV47177.1 DNA-binding transcriptional regulator [Caulobacter flavus]PLR21153.1 DNA-binding transcriptional regulator [Caulobacter flavus]
MRHEKATKLLDLARRLASSSEGLTLDEMAQAMEVGRRTAERMRDAVWTAFPQMEAIEDPPTRRFRIPSGLDSLFQTPTAEELAALRTAADSNAAAGADARAAALYALEGKLLSALKGSARRRVAPDVEALVQAETIAVHAGPRPFEDQGVLAQIRSAVKGLTALSFRYEGGSQPGRTRTVTPLGILFGRSNYLVSLEGHSPRPRTFRLDRMSDVEALDRPASPPADFSLQAFADESFGIYHGEIEDVVLRIRADRAEDALRWRFHSNQVVTQGPGGVVTVAFRASGMLELAWHLFTWGDAIEIVSPESLKKIMVEELEKALAAHRRA